MKDPAVLFYISDWVVSTCEMDADCRGWYLNLILHNYDKGTLPNDLEKLAVLAGVKFSEFNRFEQVFEHVLKQKFEQTDNNRLTNERTQSVLKAREVFKDKRSNAGKKSYLMKFFAANYPKEYKDKKVYAFVIENLNTEIDTKNSTSVKQVFEQVFELYRNGNGNGIKDKNVNDFEINISQKSFKNWTLEDLQDSIKNENKTTLDRTELLAFYEYWSELSPSGKFRFQLNETWETMRRLNTWQRNKKEKGFKTVQEIQKNKMGDAFYQAAINLKNKLNTTKNGSSTI